MLIRCKPQLLPPVPSSSLAAKAQKYRSTIKMVPPADMAMSTLAAKARKGGLGFWFSCPVPAVGSNGPEKELLGTCPFSDCSGTGLQLIHHQFKNEIHEVPHGLRVMKRLWQAGTKLEHKWGCGLSKPVFNYKNRLPRNDSHVGM